MIVGLDLSKRSSGVVAIDMEGKLLDFMVISPEKSIDNEELLECQWLHLSTFLYEYKKVEGIAIEGLSFNSVGSGKDLLAGLQWTIRLMLHRHYSSIPVGVIPNQSWFSKVGTKEERKALSESNEKDKRKKFALNKLPWDVKVQFEGYVRENGLKKESVYDLSDAYHLAQYRWSLEK